MENLLEMSSSEDKELHSQIETLTAKRETKKKEAENLALKYNEIVTEHNKQIDWVKSL